MNRLRIRHTTAFTYAADVSASYNEARMRPVSSDSQLVLSSTLQVEPSASLHDYTDYWGTRVTAFEVITPHRSLSVSSTTLVEARPKEHAGHAISWEELRSRASNEMELIEQLGQTRLTEPTEDVARLAEEIVAQGLSPCETATAIARTVGESMEYMQGVTGVHSTAAEAWAEKKGVCQDITHIALGALRSAGIPARYVSGYLHPKREPVVGESVKGESHAWVEWFCGQWTGYDPTNLIDIADRHVLVGAGRDYSDVPPLHGVYAGPRASDLKVSVEITRVA
ncbi:transglutaminase family protein [Planctomonas deserti]|uniref:transglutaminase family protein n=1 Tax=Planctomonas deserti TaxID=2144185 RepID=UPI000D3DC94F|nr:transglutaminase family protein [Planctomonas deserti]